MALHKDLTGDDAIHQSAYIQSSDPGAVGAKKLWIDTTSGYVLKKRKDDDSGWDTLGTLSTGVTVTDGDKGDITISSTGTVYTIDNDVVTYAKMQNVSATDKLLGRSTSGAGDVEEIACTSAARSVLDDATVADMRTTLGAATASQPEICCGRLTLESGVAVSTSDQTAKTNVYWTPYHGARIALYNGSTWDTISFSETTLALGTLTSGKNYDVFGYNNSGTLALEALAWTDDTTRATALALQDGVLAKTGALTRRYLGTFRTTSTTTTEDSAAKRFLWNQYHQKRRPMVATDTTDNWSYNTGTWRQANAAAGNKVEYVSGQTDVVVEARVLANLQVSSTSARASSVAVGLDSTSTPSGQVRGTGFTVSASQSCWPTTAEYRGAAQLGYHYLAWLEYGGDGTVTWFGDNGSSTHMQSGLTAVIEG